jgi:hypothetical protein
VAIVFPYGSLVVVGKATRRNGYYARFATSMLFLASRIGHGLSSGKTTLPQRREKPSGLQVSYGGKCSAGRHTLYRLEQINFRRKKER